MPESSSSSSIGKCHDKWNLLAHIVIFPASCSHYWYKLPLNFSTVLHYTSSCYKALHYPTLNVVKNCNACYSSYLNFSLMIFININCEYVAMQYHCQHTYPTDHHRVEIIINEKTFQRTMHCNVLQCNPAKCSGMQCNALKCIAVLCN